MKRLIAKVFSVLMSIYVSEVVQNCLVIDRVNVIMREGVKNLIRFLYGSFILVHFCRVSDCVIAGLFFVFVC